MDKKPFKCLTTEAITSNRVIRLYEIKHQLEALDDFAPEICAEIKKIDPKTDLAKARQNVNSYVMTKIAHAGARKNNLVASIQGMNAIFEGKHFLLKANDLVNTPKSLAYLIHIY